MYTIWGHLNKLCRGCAHNYLIWLESHGTSYEIALFCEHFFKIVTIFKVYYFSWQLGHITWHNAKDLYCFDRFWISYAYFKMRPKRWAWPLLGWDRILPNYLWISDEIDACVSKNDFWKKLWANYKALVVQIWPALCWIDIILSISWGVPRKLFPCKGLVNCA
jgi:hypothetical protein